MVAMLKRKRRLRATLAASQKSLAHRLFYFGNPIGTLQHFSWLRTVRRADDAVLLHQIDEVCGAAIANSQPPLQQGSGSLSEFNHEFYCIPVHGIVFRLAAFPCFASRASSSG